MTQDMRDIWSAPEGGRFPDITPHLEAGDLQEMCAVSQAQTDPSHGAGWAMGGGFRRMWRDWQSRRAGGVGGSGRSGRAGQGAKIADGAIFGFDLPLARTHPGDGLPFEPADIQSEVARMVEALTLQMTVARGRGPRTVRLPDPLPAALDESVGQGAPRARRSDRDKALWEARHIVAYWAPARAPALALSVRQQDPAHAYEIRLLAHGLLAHGRFLQVLADHGGELT